jgi:predicted membrane protein
MGDNDEDKNERHDSWGNRNTTAYILLGIAAYLILSSTGFLDLIGLRDLIRWVFRTAFNLIPLAVVVFGVIWLSKTESGQKPIFAWFLIAFGAVLLISQFGLFGLSFGEMFLPFWLVVVALLIMNPRNILPRGLNTLSVDEEKDSSSIKLVAFMGGGDLNYTSRVLRNGEVIAVWGGYNIDFTGADMEDDVMVLNLICIMGGVEIIIPPNWEVDKQAICIMGGFSNKSHCIAEKLDLPRKKLIIKGFALMGGGEIKN